MGTRRQPQPTDVPLTADGDVLAYSHPSGRDNWTNGFALVNQVVDELLPAISDIELRLLLAVYRFGRCNFKAGEPAPEVYAALEHLCRIGFIQEVPMRHCLGDGDEYAVPWMEFDPQPAAPTPDPRAEAIARNGGSHTAAEWRELKARYDYRCVCCGQREPDVSLHKDHVIPVSCGGRNDIQNLQPLCQSCNSAKRTKTMDFRPTFDALLASLQESF